MGIMVGVPNHFLLLVFGGGIIFIWAGEITVSADLSLNHATKNWRYRILCLLKKRHLLKNGQF